MRIKVQMQAGQNLSDGKIKSYLNDWLHAILATVIGYTCMWAQ